MAGTLVIDTLQDGSGNSTSATNAIQGSAKAWVKFAGSTGTINAGYNVSSVTRNAVGIYTVNFTNALADANYCASTSCMGVNSSSFIGNAFQRVSQTQTTTAFQFTTSDTNGPYDPGAVHVAIFR